MSYEKYFNRFEYPKDLMVTTVCKENEAKTGKKLSQKSFIACFHQYENIGTSSYLYFCFTLNSHLNLKRLFLTFNYYFPYVCLIIYFLPTPIVF